MAMGKQREGRQGEFWIETSALARSGGHPFYEKLNALLKKHGFDVMVENECVRYYAEKMGRPSIPPGVYFRMLFVGFFEGIDSERGIAWRVADSLALREFLGYALNESTPDHSSVSRTRRLMDLETHQLVFDWVLQVLAKDGLLKGKTLGVDATTLEANAALRSIVRRDTGESYDGFLKQLAQASGIEMPTREDLAKLDKGRKGKGSNSEWVHPHDPDARIAKMKDGQTHLAHKAEHAVDLDTEAVVAVTVQGADEGDTATGPATLLQSAQNLLAVCEEPEARKNLSRSPLSEAVVDKGYHSDGFLLVLDTSRIRSYVSEPARGRRRWKGKPKERQAVYANRRRIRGTRGKALLCRRGEVTERSFAHLYETGGMRRLHLRGRENILKRLLVHAGGFDLGLVMRKYIGKGTPRGLQGLILCLNSIIWAILRAITGLQGPTNRSRVTTAWFRTWTLCRLRSRAKRTCTTGC